jgi:phycobilisome core component
MRDAITGLIGRYDQLGRYFDRSAIDRIEGYFGQAELRLKAVELINREAAELVREASQRLFVGDPELLLPGGNAYTTRRLAACLRDMDYFLRYASYALIADDSTILNERVLNGLDDTYKSLGVPTGPTVRSMSFANEWWRKDQALATVKCFESPSIIWHQVFPQMTSASAER